MGATSLLLLNGFVLSVLLIILLVFLAFSTGPSKKRRKVKDDISKIKDQINGD